MIYEFIGHKTMKLDFNMVAMATGNRPIRKLCNLIQIWIENRYQKSGFMVL